MLSRRRALGLLASLPLIGKLEAPSPASAAAAPQAKALVIGVNQYKSMRPLTRAVPDAEAVARTLTAIGYDAELVCDPTSAELWAAIDAYSQSLERDVPSLLFFAGHAVQLQQTNLLLAKDSQAGSIEAIGDSSLPLPLALQKIARRQPSQSIVILDACRDDPLRSPLPQVEAGLSSINAPRGFFIFYSAGSGETALDSLRDDDPDPNSVFTRALLPWLEPDASIHEVVVRTKLEVNRLASSVGHDQHPAVYDQSDAPALTLLGRRSNMTDTPPIARPTDPLSQFLAIGISRYANLPVPLLLEGPSEDANLVASSLRACGIQGEVRVNPDDLAMRQAIAELARSAATTVILYYAGYGAYDDGDAVLVGNLAASSWERLLERSPRLGEIVAELQRPSRRIVLILDCCLEMGPSSRLEPTGLIDRLRDDPAGVEASIGQVALIAASKIGGMAYDIVPGLQHGPFAQALQNAFSRPGQPMVATADQVLREVREMTAAALARPSPSRPGQKSLRAKCFPPAGTPVLADTRQSGRVPQETAFWATPAMTGFAISQALE
ncbi:MAG TPA: caspase family protein [Allosphingosinicella sp.]|nr:caspase family protein [Allosphingosinicella sp.]